MLIKTCFCKNNLIKTFFDKLFFQDKTVRFWDLRTRGCVNMVTPATNPNSRSGSPVAGNFLDGID